MARVPTYGTPQVEARNLPNVRISDAPAQDIRRAGMAMAQGLGDMGQVANKFAMEEQEKVNESHLRAAERALNDVETELLNDPEKGAFSQTLGAARGLHERVMPEWDKRVSTIEDGLPAHLRGKFGVLRDRRTAQARDAIMRHSLGETEKFYDLDTAATVKSHADRGIRNWQNPELVDEAAAMAVEAQVLRLQQKNAPASAIDEARRTTASTVYRGAVERVLLENPGAALERLDRVRDLLTADDLMAIEEKLQPTLVEEDGESLVQSWLDGRPAGLSSEPIEGAAKSEAEAVSIAKAAVGRTIKLESGGDAKAKNSRSSATGAGQFLAATWVETVASARPDLWPAGVSVDQAKRSIRHGKSSIPAVQAVLDRRTDGQLSQEMTEAYAADNARFLYRSGLPVTAETVYMAHRFGPEGARKLLRADPSTPVAKLVSAEVMATNPDLAGKSVADLSASHARRAGEKVAMPVMRQPNGEVDWAGMKELALGIANSNLRRSALSAIERRQAIERERETQQETAFAESIFTKIEAGEKLSPDERAYAVRKGRLDEIERAQRARRAGTLVQTDPLVLDKYWRMSVYQPDEFAKPETKAAILRDGLTSLDTGDVRSLLADQAALADPAKRGAKQQDWATAEQRIREATVTLGYHALPPDVARQRGAELGMAYRQARRAAIEGNGGKALTPQQEQAVVDTVVHKFATTVVADAKGTEQGQSVAGRQAAALSSFVAKVSPADMQRVRAVLREEYGREPYEWEVQRAAARRQSEKSAQ